MNKKEFTALSADEQYEAFKAAEKSATDAQKAVVELNEQLATVENNATAEVPTVTIDKVEYRVIGNVRVPADLREELGKDILNAREVAANKKFATRLLKERSGQLIEVQPEEKED